MAVYETAVATLRTTRDRVEFELESKEAAIYQAAIRGSREPVTGRLLDAYSQAAAQVGNAGVDQYLWVVAHQVVLKWGRNDKWRSVVLDELAHVFAACTNRFEHVLSTWSLSVDRAEAAHLLQELLVTVRVDVDNRLTRAFEENSSARVVRALSGVQKTFWLALGYLARAVAQHFHLPVP